MKAAGTPLVKPVGNERKVYGASFLTSYGGYLWSGKFNNKGRDKMYQYKINSNGSLTTIKKAWEVPTKTQGLLVTGSHFIFSTSVRPQEPQQPVRRPPRSARSRQGQAELLPRPEHVRGHHRVRRPRLPGLTSPARISTAATRPP